jgi:hypothetical protein
MKRPLALWILCFGLLFLGFGGLYGGISMLIDPTGRLMNMDAVLPQLLVPNYILPGLFLLFVMGLFPLFLCVALITRPNWPMISRLVFWRSHYWAWTCTLALCLILFLWLAVQGFLIGFIWPIQFITLSNGILILLFSLLPTVQEHFLQ